MHVKRPSTNLTNVRLLSVFCIDENGQILTVTLTSRVVTSAVKCLLHVMPIINLIHLIGLIDLIYLIDLFHLIELTYLADFCKYAAPRTSINISVADPDPDSDPVGSGLFGSPGSGSGSGKKIYGSGSFIHNNI